jgi:hypothetical protein
MSQPQQHPAWSESQLLDCLRRIDFGRRYYAYCDANAGKTADPALTREDFQHALNASGVAFTYNASERFFGHRETHAEVTLALNAVISRTDLELVLAVIGPHETVGGTFHGLSYRLMRMADPSWQHSPRYPRLPFHTLPELSAALSFGLGLYREALPLILADLQGS